MRITSLLFFKGILLLPTSLSERMPEKEIRSVSEKYRNSSTSVANHMQMSSSIIRQCLKFMLLNYMSSSCLDALSKFSASSMSQSDKIYF